MTENNMNIAGMSMPSYMPSGGTPLSALKNQQGNIQQMHQMQQNEQPQLTEDLRNYEKYVQSKNKNMNHLVTAINKSLDDYAPSPETVSREDEADIENENEDDDQSSSGFLNNYPNWVKELLLFVAVYCFLSIGMVKNTIGTYIKYIQPGSDGNVGIIGIILYGLLVGASFILLRKLLLKF